MAAQTMSKKRKATAPPTAASAKKPRKANQKPQPKSAAAKVHSNSAKAKKAPPASLPLPKSDDEPVEDGMIAFDNDDDAASAASSEDDQTAALLKGFESSDDEEPSTNTDPDTAPITNIPAIPTTTSLTSLTAASTTPTPPRVIYIGRIPHGFYEHQMRAYFSQFGAISRLRLARNRRTGASKHYAFIEFESGDVARIVADTMDNYLMFGHLLKAKIVPAEKVHAELFKGAGRRFKKVPWNKIERGRLEGADREGWKRRVEGEERRRGEKKEKLLKLGYEFEAPGLRRVEDVPVAAAVDGAEATPAVTAAGVEETAKEVEDAHVKAIEAGPEQSNATAEPSVPVSAEPLILATAPQGDVTQEATFEETVAAPAVPAADDTTAQDKPTAKKGKANKAKAPKAAAAEKVSLTGAKRSGKANKAR